ncbi:hypothetical protein [Sulfitobacter sp. M13]
MDTSVPFRKDVKFRKLKALSAAPYFLLICAILSTPWNMVVLDPLRFNDIFIVSALVISSAFLPLSKKLLTALAAVFFALLISILFNADFLGSADFTRLAFVYKYAIPIIVPIVFVATTVSTQRLRGVEISLLVSFLILVAWAYYYKFSVDSGSIFGLSRLSYPGSKDFLVSDAHLYSNYLSMALIFYFLYLRRSLKHPVWVTSAVVIFSMGGLILSGSRNGLAVIIVSAIIYSVLKMASGRAHISRSFAIKASLILFILGFIASYIHPVATEFFAEASERAFKFDFFNDVSSMSRVLKFEIAISEWLSSSVFFGASIFGASLTWYDSGLGIILTHIGLGGLLLILLIIFYFLRLVARTCGSNSIVYAITATLVISYAFSNGITEFALVTRSALPVSLFIAFPLVAENIRRKI